jgi:hypothetical protein
MANEAVLILQTGIPVPMTCADGTSITKGAILKLSDPNTVALSDGASDLIGGIAGADKIANDGVIKIPVFRAQGSRFKVMISGSAAVGDPLTTDAAPNNLKLYVQGAAFSGSRIIGTILETATTGETALMELNIQNGTF